jgi:preprotein translocase subunit SecF
MEFIKPNINFDFVGKMKMAFSASIAAILISIVSLAIHGGPNYGIDFAGGTLVQVKFQRETDTDKIRNSLTAIGMGDSVLQEFGAKENN